MRRPLKYKWNSASGLPSVWQVKVRRLWRSTVVFLGTKMSFVPAGASKKRSKITRLIQERLCISFTRYCSLDIRSSLDIYWCLFLFSFTFLSPYSACFGVFSNFLTRFSRPALRLLLLTLFGRSAFSFQPIFIRKPLSTNLNNNNFLRLTKF